MKWAEDFKDYLDIASLAKNMIELEKHTMFHAVYRLIELARNAFNNSESNR
jgi:hypothetical protein